MNKSLSFDLKGMMDFFPDMVCVVDENGIIIDCNDAQAKKLGYTKKELIGKSGFDLIDDEDKKYAFEEFEKLQHQDKVENIELWGLTKNGRYRALTTTSKIPYPDGTKKYLIVSKDITQSYIQQKKLKEIKENFSNLGEITSKIAHDIRNPLSVMKAQIFTLNNQFEGNKELKKRLDIMDKLVSEINSIVSDIVNYTKIETESKEKTTSGELMDIALQGIAIPNSIKLDYSKNDTTIICDKNKLSIVLRNLISNAIDAMQENGKITIEFSEDSNNSTIKVTDSGEGIPDEISEKIFDLLFTTKSRGTGLGLSICKNIVENHKGTISFSNNPTTFIIKLPKLQEN